MLSDRGGGDTHPTWTIIYVPWHDIFQMLEDPPTCKILRCHDMTPRSFSIWWAGVVLGRGMPDQPPVINSTCRSTNFPDDRLHSQRSETQIRPRAVDWWRDESNHSCAEANWKDFPGTCAHMQLPRRCIILMWLVTQDPLRTTLKHQANVSNSNLTEIVKPNFRRALARFSHATICLQTRNSGHSNFPQKCHFRIEKITFLSAELIFYHQRLIVWWQRWKKTCT